ncbi:AarF/ABC1/UbiB kinase family protein [Salinisphaera sp.]|uniref:ABC1 kinase family protein n=1 Tax=Salinisphaera sp. TaxID=1914330 RepID=UPI002D7A074D|nr:AarF/ABC1/UbiB kinase family protein [Salinisphaera sp.]HET7314304.1 AarF/ABC1/UbiB kinase family protein [Salinisphaera sp.]
MASDSDGSKRRRRRIIGAGIRTLSRGAMRGMPGYDRAKSLQRTGQDWYDTLGGLKGAAMKLGQIAAQYQDLLPPQLTEQLARLQRDAEPWDFVDLEPVLVAHWTNEQRDRVAHIDEAALAAASIGQVHAARLIDGREVVIKIRYPGVADSIDADVANLGRLLKWSRFLPIGGRDLDAVLGELRARFVEETDYRRELANLKLLRGLKLRDFELPEPVDELCTEAILVTTRLDSWALETGDPKLGAAVVEAVNRQVFEAGALHADPHAGNFGITEQGAMALYDFGCLKYLDPATRAAMRDILAAAMAEDWVGVHDGMARLGAVPEDSWEKHSEIYREIYIRHAESALAPLRDRRPYVFERDELIDSIRAEIGRSMAYWRYFRAAPDMVFVMRTLSGLYWILRSLHAEVDLYGELERIVAGEYGPYDDTMHGTA